MNLWFTSDLHFGHRNIISFCDRPFQDQYAFAHDGAPLAMERDAVASMNAAMVEQWNSQVADNDQVVVVGDMAMGHLADSFSYIDQLKGKLFLVPGNHDRCWSGASEAQRAKWLPEYEKRFTIKPERFEGSFMCSAGDIEVLVCHFPYAPAGEYDGRYADQHPVDEGKWLIHGHIHDLWRKRGRQINVGIDAWGGRLVHFDQIADLMRLGSDLNLPPISWRLTAARG